MTHDLPRPHVSPTGAIFRGNFKRPYEPVRYLHVCQIRTGIARCWHDVLKIAIWPYVKPQWQRGAYFSYALKVIHMSPLPCLRLHAFPRTKTNGMRLKIVRVVVTPAIVKISKDNNKKNNACII